MRVRVPEPPPGESTTVFRLKCRDCEEVESFNVFSQDIRTWKLGGHPHAVFPYLSPEKRDFLIVGRCFECLRKWRILFNSQEPV